MSKLGLVAIETWQGAPMLRCALCNFTATKADAMTRHLIWTHRVGSAMATEETTPNPPDAAAIAPEQSPPAIQPTEITPITPAPAEQPVEQPAEQAAAPEPDPIAPEPPAEGDVSHE